MLRKKAHLRTYRFAAIIFFMVAAVNGWMIVSEGHTPFRIIAAVTFTLGGLLLLAASSRLRKSGR